MDYNKIIFKKKTIADLMQEVYVDKQEKGNQLKSMIGQLKDLIHDGGDAVMMVPLIKEYMDLLIKNDESVIKIVQTIQKFEAVAARTVEENGGVMSERDKQLLFESLDDLGISNN